MASNGFLHNHPDFSELLRIVAEEHGIDPVLVEKDYISVHRWKYAIIEHTKNSGFHFDLHTGIAATSDWASTSEIEEVWLDASKLANKIIESVL